LEETDATDFDLTSFVAAAPFKSLTLSKEYSAMNFPGKLLFEITTTSTIVKLGNYLLIRFPGYYDNQISVGTTCSIDKVNVQCSRLADR